MTSYQSLLLTTIVLNDKETRKQYSLHNRLFRLHFTRIVFISLVYRCLHENDFKKAAGQREPGLKINLWQKPFKDIYMQM